MNTAFLSLIDNFINELRENTNLIVANTQTSSPLNNKEKGIVKGVIPSNTFDFHQEMNGLIIEWKSREETPDVKGLVKILSLEEILRDWEGVIYFDFAPNEDRMKNFYPIDFFVAEACTGAFLNEANQEDRTLYLHSLGGELTALKLDINGYIQMMVASKGFLYWQYAVREILEKEENPQSQRFKEWIPQLFPDFSWQAYVDQYNQVRIQD